MASAKNAKSPSNSAGESTLDSSTTSSLATKEEEQRPKRKHPLQHFLAGGMAGFVESSCCHPLDTIKTRMQLRRQQAQSIGHSLRNINPLNRRGASSIGVAPLNRSSMSEPGTPTSAAKSSSTGLATSRGVGSSAGMASRVHGLGPIGTARRIIDREGFAALYKGLTAVYTGIIPKMAIRFVSFEYYRDVLLSREVMPPITSTFVAGLASGITEAIMVVTPAEVCKIRMQAQYHSMMDPVQMKHRKYTNVVQTAMTIVKEEGVGALYKGVVPTMMRQGCNQAANFTAYGWLKRKWSNYQQSQGYESSELQPWQHLLLGGLSGGLGPTINNPLDVVKTRMQKQVIIRGQKPRYSGLVQSCMVIAKDEGAMALWKGLTPRLLRIMPGQAITFMTYEFASKQLQRFGIIPAVS